MSPRAFQTILIASIGSKDRLELESKVLAAALKQSHARGDTSGVALAHKQIRIVLRQQQAVDKAANSDSGDQTGNRVDSLPATPTDISLSTADNKGKKRKRVMPNIVWTEDEGSPDSGATASAPGDPQSEDRPTAESQSQQSDDDDEGEESGAKTEESDELDLDLDKPTFDAYGILNVEQIASFEDIHKSFLVLVRRVLMGLKKAKRKQRKPLLDELQNLWIAHDILSDPVTRTDFDFRILGLRGAPDVIIHSAPEDKNDSISARTPLRIGELMQCAGLLEPTELEIAADMHKAMPEMLFGAFLVKQGFISEEDLGQVLMGQRLLKNGNLTVGHYQMCMKRWREHQTPIEETAVAEGLVTQSEMERIVMSGLRDTAGVPAYQGGGGSIRATAPRINAEEAAKRNLSVGHAVPQWKDQLDWSEPEAIEEYVADDRESEQRKQVESSLDIEGITDGVSKETGKKSLRRLMEGIHSPDQTPGSEEEGGAAPKSLKSILSATSELQGYVRVDRLAGPLSEDVEEAPSAESVTAESREEAMQAEQAIQAEVAQVEQAEAQAEAVRVEEAQTAQLGDAPAEAAPAEQAYLADPPAEYTHVGGSPTMEMSVERMVELGEGGAPPVVADETTIEALAVEEQTNIDSRDRYRPTTDVPVPKIVIEERTTKRLTIGDEDDENVFGEVNYDDEDDADKDADLELGAEEFAPAAEVQRKEPESVPPAPASEPPVTPSSETATPNMDDLLDFSTPSPADLETDKSDIRKVLDEAFHGAKVPELPPQVPTPPEVAATAVVEAQFEAIAEEESQMGSGVYPIVYDAMGEPTLPEPHSAPPVISEIPFSGHRKEPSASVPSGEQERAAAEQAAQHAAEQAAAEHAAAEHAAAEQAAAEQAAAQQAEAEQAAAEQAAAQQAAAEQAAAEQVAAEQAAAEQAAAEQVAAEQAAAQALAEQVAEPSISANQEDTSFELNLSSPPPSNQEDTSLELSLSSSILSSVDATISTDESAIEALAEFAKQEHMRKTREHGEAEGFEIPRGVEEQSSSKEPQESSSGDSETVPSKTTVSMDVPPVSLEETKDEVKRSYEGRDTIEDTTDEIEAVKISDPLTLTRSSSANADDSSWTPSVDSTDDDSTATPAASSSADEHSQDPTASSDDKNDTPDLLKSGEWQIVYKLQGSLADVFLSEESEPEMMQKMRPRLTEIDSIIPSSIAKMSKGDADSVAKPDATKESDTKDEPAPSKGDATKSGDKKASDKPVIKPVSNNYYRNSDKGKKGDDKSGGKNKGE